MIAGGLLAAPLATEALQAKVWKLGYLDQGAAARSNPYVDGLKQGLHDLGWVEGRNIVFEVRFAEGKTDQLPGLAAELVRLKMDVIVTSTTPAALAAKRATATIPIVIGFTADPVGSGIVASLAHPGGNITGWTHSGLELRAKYLELLKEAVPDATRMGVLWDPANQVHRPSLRIIESAAQRLGVDLHLAGVQDPKEMERAFSALAEKGVQALVVFPDGMFQAQTPKILALAARYRLPTLYGLREYAELGGLMAYGANIAKMHRQISASLVDKILRGARPADLPVAQPIEFDLLINLKTAKALGLTIPPSLLQRADQVIE
ncbi:MAG TPA: ABC transporter substrate-binding protein [Gemmatimonadales bacterium]|jgi:putative ABC transport system substrate-binding protein|nr:ABC transporter substrate-binding protein [Gemmatimonadales bacterium]